MQQLKQLSMARVIYHLQKLDTSNYNLQVSVLLAIFPYILWSFIKEPKTEH